MGMSELTPMMQQYMSIKSNHKDCLLLYRMGDFYELFFDDAVQAASDMQIVLTKRGKHNGKDIPMCGIPHHSFNNYVNKLISAGHKLAICEQMESPEEAKKRGYKSVVNREVVRIITPGTLTDEILINGKEANILLSISSNNGHIAIAFADVSTGMIISMLSSEQGLESDLLKLSPKEIIIGHNLMQNANINQILDKYQNILTVRENVLFNFNRCAEQIKNFYSIVDTSIFGKFSNTEICCIGSIIEYIQVTQKRNRPFLHKPRSRKQKYFMEIDTTTRYNLELFLNRAGNRKYSLLNTIDRTITASGFRLLSQYFTNPLVDIKSINNRYDAIEFFINNNELRQQTRLFLKNLPDVERALSRINLQRETLKDMHLIAQGLEVMQQIKSCLSNTEYTEYTITSTCYQNINILEDIRNEIKQAFRDDIISSPKEGGFILSGYSQEIDYHNNILHNHHQYITELQNKYRNITQINNLKISHNNILGYYIEVNSSHTHKINTDLFIHRQTMRNNSRYITEELKTLEEKIISSKEEVLKLEIEVYDNIRNKISVQTENLLISSNAVAKLDVFSSLAELSIKNNYIRPTIDNSNNIVIKDGRHPVVEKNLKNQIFIENNCELNDQQLIYLITGPNMSGKSTFLRQNAIIIIMAQIGLYVPASYAHIGIVDKIFSRIGAHDDINQGKSTFMVEMLETATILNQATNKSFIIMDEIGRGTATYDGLSIAWAVLEYLHDKNIRTLFSTHYHELTEIALDKIANFQIAVEEWEDSIIFLHKLVKGYNNRSYGLQVARLAGIPKKVIDRADEILCKLSDQ